LIDLIIGSLQINGVLCYVRYRHNGQQTTVARGKDDRMSTGEQFGAGLSVKALFFDVFGTLVDWRSSIAREAEALLKPKAVVLDYFAFADAWRGEYQGALEEVRAGRIGFCKLDILHRRNLELTLDRFGVSNLGEEEKRRLNLAWHQLDAWPDVPAGLARLKRGSGIEWQYFPDGGFGASQRFSVGCNSRC